MRDRKGEDIPLKANWLLHLTLLALLVLFFRVWQLAVLERDERIEEARAPMVKRVLEPAKRGTIRDRFNIPLAINAINYQVAVVWARIAEVPTHVWERDEEGTRVKRPLRREYVESLSKLIAKELSMDPVNVEDQIWSTASFFGSAPFVVKEGISEAQYYRLKGLSRIWPGLEPMIGSKRRYPHGMIACDVLGYMGAINRDEIQAVLKEIQTLQETINAIHLGEPASLPEGLNSIADCEERLKLLQERAYTIHDFIGKSGIEKRFESSLRGALGRREYESDARGNFLRELPGSKEPASGKRLLLTISKELQEYAEQLLAFEEKVRDERSLHARLEGKRLNDVKAPWMKGGSVVAIDPNNGEILALASYPRFDPNDFIPNNQLREEKERVRRVHRWLETEKYIGWLFDQKVPIMREFYDVLTNRWEIQEEYLTYDRYLEHIFPKKGAAYEAISEVKNLREGYRMLQKPSSLDYLQQKDRELVLDLLNLFINQDVFDEELLAKVGDISISEYRDQCCRYFKICEELLEEQRALFHQEKFPHWRENFGKEFLKEKRQLERQKGTYAKPYLDYFNEEERRQFAAWWEENGAELLIDLEYSDLQKSLSSLSKEQKVQYLSTMRIFDELKRPLIGSYRQLRKGGTLKELAMAFYPTWGFGVGRSYGYRQSGIQGSIFKIVTAYAGLKSNYQRVKERKSLVTRSDINTFEIIDEVKRDGNRWEVGRFLDGTKIPQVYKGGRIPRSMNYNLGRVDLVRAMETSSNPFFSLVAADIVESPQAYIDTMRSLSYGEKTGIDLTGEISGKIPTDLEENRTGLYATAIGQHTLVATPIQAAVMLSAIANGGKVFKPQLVKLLLDESKVETLQPEIKREVPMARPIQELLFEGMKRVLSHGKPEHLYRYYPGYRDLIKEYGDIHKSMMGKTSTSEALELLNVGAGQKAYMVNHIWFGGICFEERPLDSHHDLLVAKDPYGKPELVVIVYLRFGRLGKETIPVAALLAKRWREIKASYQ